MTDFLKFIDNIAKSDIEGGREEFKKTFTDVVKNLLANDFDMENVDIEIEDELVDDMANSLENEKDDNIDIDNIPDIEELMNSESGQVNGQVDNDSKDDEIEKAIDQAIDKINDNIEDDPNIIKATDVVDDKTEDLKK